MFQGIEDVLLPRLASYWPKLELAMDDTSYSNAQMKADAYKVHGAFLVSFHNKPHYIQN